VRRTTPESRQVLSGHFSGQGLENPGRNQQEQRGERFILGSARTHKEEIVKSQLMNKALGLFTGAAMLFSGAGSSWAAGTPDSTVPVTMTVTASVADGKRVPNITRDDLVVRQGKSRLKVTGWVPAQGARAGLELFILIDDSVDARFSLHYDDLRAFMTYQPATTLVGVGYMRNGTVQIAQNPTANHALAAQALRMPLGYPGAYGSPYLSVTDLMKKWPVTGNRREVVMITSGIGRAHERHLMNWRMGYRQDPDVDTATGVAQRTGTNIFSIYTPNSAHFRASQWALVNGQMNLSQLSDRTGGAAFYLGLHSPVTIQPYLSELQRMINNQYLLSFSAKAGKKSGLQTINLSTEVAGIDLTAHNSVWVAGAK
jgi:hypothetical protein